MGRPSRRTGGGPGGAGCDGFAACISIAQPNSLAITLAITFAITQPVPVALPALRAASGSDPRPG